MSVNEVRQRRAATPLVIKGNATGSSSTFCIGDEGHTLGNALRHVLMQNRRDVSFAGYSVPHPSDPVVQIRVQTTDSSPSKSASRVLQQACQTLSEQCDIVLQKLEEVIPEVKVDRLALEEQFEPLDEEGPIDDEANELDDVGMDEDEQ